MERTTLVPNTTKQGEKLSKEHIEIELPSFTRKIGVVSVRIDQKTAERTGRPIGLLDLFAGVLSRSVESIDDSSPFFSYLVLRPIVGRTLVERHQHSRTLLVERDRHSHRRETAIQRYSIERDISKSLTFPWFSGPDVASDYDEDTTRERRGGDRGPGFMLPRNASLLSSGGKTDLDRATLSFDSRMTILRHPDGTHEAEGSLSDNQGNVAVRKLREAQDLDSRNEATPELRDRTLRRDPSTMTVIDSTSSVVNLTSFGEGAPSMTPISSAEPSNELGDPIEREPIDSQRVLGFEREEALTYVVTADSSEGTDRNQSQSLEDGARRDFGNDRSQSYISNNDHHKRNSDVSTSFDLSKLSNGEVDHLVDRVYTGLERKLRVERERRGR